MPGLMICALYKCRCQVELFFKWIKQHLRIKPFYGRSENAVKTQLWIAVSIYVLVALVHKRLNLKTSLYTLLQVISVTFFEKMPIQSAFALDNLQFDNGADENQLNLFLSNRTEVHKHRNTQKFLLVFSLLSGSAFFLPPK